MDMGVLKQCLRDEAAGNRGSASVSLRGHNTNKGTKGTEYSSPAKEKEASKSAGKSQKGTAKLQTPHGLIMSCIVRYNLVQKHNIQINNVNLFTAVLKILRAEI